MGESMRKQRLAGAMLACIAFSMGCGHQGVVQSELPIKRVVIYRNGVAYFERAGHVEKDEVRFKMRQAEVGDFLATLAVMERGGSSVRSAAFPLKDETGKPKDDKEDPDTALRMVVLSLDGRAHDLQVGYIAASPVWRPSHRLVLRPGGEAELQAWGIVENLSGEDWSVVRLSLVAGAPLAFEAQLGTPVIPARPIVTDSGEVIISVPKGETSLEDKDMDGIPDKNDAIDETKPAAPAASATPAAPSPPPAPDAQAATGSAWANPNAKAQSDKPSPNNIPRRAEGHVQPSQTRNVHSLAAVAVQGGTTR